MKKLIALFATSTLASTAAVAGVALSGTATVSYDDNGSAASATTYDADLTIVGTSGGSTLTAVYGLEGADMATESVDLATTIGPVTIAADMFNVAETNLDDGDGDYASSEEPDDRSITVTLDAPVGDMTIGLDDDGEVTLMLLSSGSSLDR